MWKRRNKKKNFSKLNFLYIWFFLIWIFLYFNYSFKKVEIKKVIVNKEKITKNIKKEEKKEKSIYEKFDLESDNSITKFVNNKISFTDKKYSPKNLKSIRHIFIYSTKNNSAVLREEAQEALKKMSIKFWENFEWNKIKIISWYRPYEEQNRIEKSWACHKALCAKAGFSEHQTGLAIDIFETDEKLLEDIKIKKYMSWIEENAYKFGFHNTYQKWIKVDWYQKEAWHFRYLWVELATYLQRESMSFAEFYEGSL